MRYDTVIVGGGLSALACGIRLQRKGLKTAICATPQSALYFSSGSFGLLSKMPNGTAVSRPLESIPLLPENHPYSKVGIDSIRRYADSMPAFFNSCGLPVSCFDDHRNAWRYLAVGSVKPAWMSLEDVTLFETEDAVPADKVMIVNIKGFMDFFPGFIQDSLQKRGVQCRCVDTNTPETEALRDSAAVMRVMNLAKIFESEDACDVLAWKINSMLMDEDAVILPMLFGLKDGKMVERLRERISAQIFFFNTSTPSIPGLRAQYLLRTEYENAGGTILAPARSSVMENSLCNGIVIDGSDDVIEADNYILATGSFLGKGLLSEMNRIYEPLFGLDVEAPENRSDWYSPEMSGKQNYMSAGVIINKSFHPSINGVPVENVYAIGSVLSGANALYEGCGAGVALMTAFKVSELIAGE